MFAYPAKAAAAAALCAALLAAPAAPAAPKAVELADGVYALSEAYYVSLAVVGDDGVLITDPANPPRAEALKAAIAELAGKPVTHIALTHEHYDHVGGTGVFPGAQVICHSACAAVFALDETGMAPAQVHATFDDVLDVDFAGPRVQMRYLGPVDGFGHAMVHLPGERIVFTADMYGDNAITPGIWMDDGNYLARRSALAMLAEMDLVHAVNSHSDNTSPDIIQGQAAFAEDLYALAMQAIGEAMAAGGPERVASSIERWQNELKLPQYADWRGYEENFPWHVRRMVLSIFHGG